MRWLVVAMAILIGTGCAGGPLGEVRPLGEARLEPDAVSGGERLALSRWPAVAQSTEGPKAIILALHGFGDYGPSTFDAAARFWAERGITVYAYDQRGFGRNESRGVWPGAARLIADFRDVARAIRRHHPGVPLYALGHSMGGGVVLAGSGSGDRPESVPGAPSSGGSPETGTGPQSASGRGVVDGVILAAPAVWGGENLNLAYRAAAWAGALAAPEKRWSGKGVVRIQASDNLEALRALGRDKVILGKPSSREFMGLIRLMDQAVAAAPHLAVPSLFLYGERDQVTPKGPTMDVFATVRGDKTLKLYPEGWHLLFRDVQAEAVFRDVAAWVESRQ